MPKSKTNEFVSRLLYDAGLIKNIELLSLNDTPIPPIPLLLNGPAGSIAPKLKREYGEFTCFCPFNTKVRENRKRRRNIVLFRIVFENMI